MLENFHLVKNSFTIHYGLVKFKYVHHTEHSYMENKCNLVFQLDAQFLY